MKFNRLIIEKESVYQYTEDMINNFNSSIKKKIENKEECRLVPINNGESYFFGISHIPCEKTKDYSAKGYLYYCPECKSFFPIEVIQKRLDLELLIRKYGII